jgi:hypothetical protein
MLVLLPSKWRFLRELYIQCCSYVLYVFRSVALNSVLLTAEILKIYPLLKPPIIFFGLHNRTPLIVVQQKKCQVVKLSSCLPQSVVQSTRHTSSSFLLGKRTLPPPHVPQYQVNSLMWWHII